MQNGIIFPLFVFLSNFLVGCIGRPLMGRMEAYCLLDRISQLIDLVFGPNLRDEGNISAPELSLIGSKVTA